MTAELATLHFYQLSIPAPKALAGFHDKAAYVRKKTIFNSPRKCATCHIPPILTEPGHNMHAPDEIGIGSFLGRPFFRPHVPHGAARRIMDASEGRFFHDGHLAALLNVVNHYDSHLKLNLSEWDKKDLIGYLNGI